MYFTFISCALYALLLCCQLYQIFYVMICLKMADFDNSSLLKDQQSIAYLFNFL